MDNGAFVVVFPSMFSKNKLDSLISNIKKILKIQNQQYTKVKRDGEVIVVEANDPVFASSAINLLFGISRVAIAKQVKNNFESLVSEIAEVGKRLFLKGDLFYVRVDGSASGFVPKDLELAITSSLIEKTAKLGAKPGTKEKYDKLLYTFLTKSNAYICLFFDEGNEGIPNNSQNKKSVCCIYDELSAISCLETIKEGFDVKIVVCYSKNSELLNLVKIINHILPRTLNYKINLEFFKIKIDKKNTKNLLEFINTITKVAIEIAKNNKIPRVSLALSPLIFPSDFIEKNESLVFQNRLFPQIPLAGLDDNIFASARKIGFEKHLPRIEKLAKLKFGKFTSKDSKVNLKEILKSKKKISVKIGPNNVHDILDSLKVKH